MKDDLIANSSTNGRGVKSEPVGTDLNIVDSSGNKRDQRQADSEVHDRKRLEVLNR
jgi:hypothetical protein